MKRQTVDAPKIGRTYHLAWAKNGCQWKLKSIDENGIYCTLITPTTRKEIRAKVEDLRNTRKNEVKQAAGRRHNAFTNP